MAVLNAEMGALVRRQFRNELERIKFLGHPISWHESKGWVESRFTIKAPDYIVRALIKAMEKWNED